MGESSEFGHTNPEVAYGCSRVEHRPESNAPRQSKSSYDQRRETNSRMSVRLPLPSANREAIETFVASHLAGLFGDEAHGSLRFVGGQRAADARLASFDVTGYGKRRNEVAPQPKRGASGLSPYIRHGLISLQQAWDHVAGGEVEDVEAFRNELLWQEYARHWYARLGRATKAGLRNELKPSIEQVSWNTDMACLDLSVGELEEEGWLVNQARLWMASHFVVREGGDWRIGEEYFFKHLLDGSRAANRLGWQWATGIGSARVYGFSRWQVEKRAAGLCASCDLVHSCPIEKWPAEPELIPVETPASLSSDHHLSTTRGPIEPVIAAEPQAVWLTAESLGTTDPALVANPDLPVIFVFDEPLLQRLQLSGKRLVFLARTLAELGESREVELWRGHPIDVVRGRRAAATFAPVPGFRSKASTVKLAELYPYPWLRLPADGSIASFEAWKRQFNSEGYHDRMVPVE